MTAAEARREAHRDSVADLIPCWDTEAERHMEDLALPAEFEDHGFESVHEVAEHIEEAVVQEIEDAKRGVSEDAHHFFEEEAEEARLSVFPLVMEEFEQYAEETGLEIPPTED